MCSCFYRGMYVGFEGICISVLDRGMLQVFSKGYLEVAHAGFEQRPLPWISLRGQNDWHGSFHSGPL